MNIARPTHHLWFVVLLSLLIMMTVGESRLWGNIGACCAVPKSVLVPLVPLMPGNAGCAVPELCPPPSSTFFDPPTPVVKLKVQVPACSKPGEPVEYVIKVFNDSAADAHHVVVKNALPANAKFVRASPEPHAREPELQWRFNTLKAGAGCDITLVLQPTDAEDVRNCTRVAFEHGQCVTTRLSCLPGDLGKPPQIVPVPKKSTENEPPIISGEAMPLLSLSIEGPKKQYLNLTARYFITVANKGKVAATNLLVDFTLTDKTIFVQANEGGKHIEGVVAWVLGTLEPGAIRTVVVAVKSPVLGEMCHKAKALADKGVKAEAQFCTTISGISALLLEMVDTDDPIPVGGTTSYPIFVRNTGSAPVTNLQLRAFIPDAMTLTRATAPVNHNLGEPLPGAKVLVFDPLPTLAPGAQADYVIFVQAAKPADVRMRIEMRADQLESGPVIEEESTRVYPEEERGAPPSLPLIRDMSLILPYRP